MVTALPGYDAFVAGDKPSADLWNGIHLQTVMFFATAAARDAALASELQEGLHAYLADSNTLTYYDGAAWITMTRLTHTGIAVATSETTTSTSYTDLATVQSVDATIGPTGQVLAVVTAEMSNSAANVCRMSFATSTGGAASDVRSVAVTGTSAHRVSVVVRQTGYTPGATVTFTAKFRVTGGTGTFLNRDLYIATF